MGSEREEVQREFPTAVLTRAELSNVDVCVVSATALCGRLNKAPLISIRRADGKKMGGSDAESEA